MQELNLEENQKPPSGNTPRAGKSQRPQGWCSRGRFLQSLRRAEDGAGGQKETAPASGVHSLEGGKEGKPALAAALPRCWLCGRWSRLLSSSSSACCGAAVVSAMAAATHPGPLTRRAAGCSLCFAAWHRGPTRPQGLTAVEHRQMPCPACIAGTALLVPALQPGTQSHGAHRHVSGSMRLAGVRCPADRRAAALVKDGDWGEGAFGLISPKFGWKISVINRHGSSSNACDGADSGRQLSQACWLHGTPDAGTAALQGKPLPSLTSRR